MSVVKVFREIVRTRPADGCDAVPFFIDDCHASAVPDDGIPLGTGGNALPGVGEMVVPRCPVHIFPNGTAAFFVRGRWINSAGRPL
jgi:hypothetical protein